jgi:hypothetical protein
VADSVDIKNKMDSVPLLEWLDDDLENEMFTVVQIRKKKKKQSKLLLELPVDVHPVRSCKRVTHSVYRKNGWTGMS